MICYWRRFTWIVSCLRLPRRRSTPMLHPRQPSHCLPRHLARSMAEMAASVATGPSTTTNTTIAVMVAATTAGTATATTAVLALLARPPPPLVPLAAPTHRGLPTAAQGMGTGLCTLAPCPLDKSICRTSWPHRAFTRLPTPIYCTLHDSIQLSNSAAIPLH
jgi:hypothetical protein